MKYCEIFNINNVVSNLRLRQCSPIVGKEQARNGSSRRMGFLPNLLYVM